MTLTLHMCLLQHPDDIHKCLIRVCLMLLHPLWCLDIERVINFERLMLLSPLHTHILLINIHCGLYHTDCVTDTATLVCTCILIIRKLRL